MFSDVIALYALSHLTRGAWIEIVENESIIDSYIGRTSHEVRGLKYYSLHISGILEIVAPHTRCVD